MADILEDVQFPDGAKNMAGISKNAYIAFESSFTTLGEPVAEPGTLDAVVEISTAHVLKSGGKVHKLTVMYDKSTIESTMVGATRKSHSWKPKAKLFYAGTEAKVLGFAATIQNADLITFLEPLNGEGMIQIGSSKLPAYVVSGSVKLGEGPEGEKGVTFEIEAPCDAPYYLYTAILPKLGA